MKLIYSLAFGVGAFFALNCGTGDGDGAYSSSGGTSAPPQQASATEPAAVEVKVIDHAFEPAEVHIKANQTVRWVWVSGLHDVVSGARCTPDGTFSSGTTTEGAPKTFAHTFATAGTFPYFCDPHCSIGMVGKVIVE